MKNIYCLIILVLAISVVSAQGTWTQTTNIPGGGLYLGVGFSIGNYGYIGSGTIGNGVNSRALWQFDPSNGTWLQKANCPGHGRKMAIAFSIGNYGYFGTGIDSSVNGYRNDFFRYDPSSNTWIARANVPSYKRCQAVAFSTQNYGYVGMGYSSFSASGYLNDFWKYDPVTDTWTAAASFPLSGRESSVAFSFANAGYVVSGFNNINSPLFYSDCWKYDESSNSWIQKAAFPAVGRWLFCGFSIGDYGYLGTGANGTSPYQQDFWEYNSISDTWQQMPQFPDGPLAMASAFSVGNCGYIVEGIIDSMNFITTPNHTWQFCPNFVSVPENNIASSVSIFPNPSTGIFSVQSEKEITAIEIYNLLGEKIVQPEMSDAKNKIDLRNQSKGIYFYKIISGEKIVATGKLIVTD